MKSKHKYFEYKTKTSKIFPLSMFRLLVFKIFKEVPYVLNYIIIMQNIYFYFWISRNFGCVHNFVSHGNILYYFPTGFLILEALWNINLMYT